MKRISWTRDEYILILDLYFQYPKTAPSKNDPVLQKYSQLLRSLNPTVASTEPRYRNVNGIYLRLMNYRSCDPYWLAQGKVGMSSGSTGRCKEIWDEFAGDADIVAGLARELKLENSQTYNSKDEANAENVSVKEGARRLRIHYSRERKSQRQQKLKEFRKTHSNLFCEACGFTSSQYPLAAQDSVFEVHHKVPLSEADGMVETKLGDLAILCANCHRAIHATEPMKSIGNLLTLSPTADQ